MCCGAEEVIESDKGRCFCKRHTYYCWYVLKEEGGGFDADGRHHHGIVNAFAAAASTFEVLSEVDTKYGKVAEREYEGLSAELKKWFKKMAVGFLVG